MIRSYLTFIFLFFVSVSLHSQCNLLKNGNFESYSPCPTGLSQIHYASFWQDANVNPNEIIYPSADYSNTACGSTGLGPANAHSGVGYVSMNASAASTTAAEMIATCVKIDAGKTYTFSMWIYGGDGSAPFFVQGVPTSTFPVPRDGRYCPTTATTLVTIPASHSGIAAWTFRSYTFTSPGNFNSIIIGGVCSGGGFNYVSIDDVSLTANVPSTYASLTATSTTLPCGGGTRSLRFNLPGGCLGPFNVTYTVNGSPVTLNNINDGHTINLSMTSNTTVVLTNVTNSNGCSFNPSSSVSYTLAGGSVTANAGANKVTTCSTPSQTLNGSQTGGSGTIQYSWSPTTGLNNPNIASPSANPASNTTYTLTVTDGNGCTDTDQVLVTVNKTAPTASAGTDKTTTCTTPTAVLNGSGGVSYSWNNGASNVQSPTVNPSTNTTYTLTVTGSNGCTDTDQVLVTVNKAVPTANAGIDKTTTCTTPTAVLNGSGGGSYVWNNGASNVQSPTVNPSTNTTYTLTVTGSNGCTATDQVLVTVNKATPTANAGTDKTTTCTTPTAVLNGSGGGSYVWNSGASNVQSPTVNPTVSTTYTLTVTASNGCTDTDQVLVTVDETAPTASAGSDILIDCATTTGVFMASGNGAYSWNTPSGTVVNSTINIDNSSSPGTYSLTVTGANGCTDTDAATLTIDQVDPVADAGLDQISNCATPTVSLVGTGSTGVGLSYNWTGPGITSGGNTSSASANVPGTYTLTVTGINFCTSADNVIVNPDTNYPIADAGLDQTIDCNDLTVTMDGSGSDSGSNITYAWTTSNGNIITGTNTNSIDADLDGTYTLQVTNTTNGCASTDNVIVTQDTVTPVIQIANQMLTIDCNNPTVTLDATGSSGVGNTYNWITTDGNILSGANTATPIVNLDGNYVLTAESSNGCSNLNSVFATVLIDTISPMISITSFDTLTCNVLEVIIDGSNSQHGVTYLWTSTNGGIVGVTNDTIITVNLGGFYTLEVMSSNGCTTLDSIEVIASTPPDASIIADPQEGEVPLSVNFSSNSAGEGLTYYWDFGSELDTSNIESPEYIYEVEGEYEVILTIEDQYGCIDMDTITILANELSAVLIPNIFTPNGDGENEIFRILGGGVKTLEGCIYNRWGQQVYSWNTIYGGWDGRTLSGKEAANGTYYYVIKIIFNKGNEETFKGSLMLVR